MPMRLLASVVLMLAVAGSTRADDPLPSAYADSLPTGTYVLAVDGRVDPSARIYRSASASAYLVLAPTSRVG